MSTATLETEPATAESNCIACAGTGLACVVCHRPSEACECLAGCSEMGQCDDCGGSGTKPASDFDAVSARSQESVAGEADLRDDEPVDDGSTEADSDEANRPKRQPAERINRMKLKPVNYEKIDLDHRAHSVMADQLYANHEELEEARIGLYWKLGWNPDKDEKLVLGKCVKISEQVMEYLGEDNELDFVILLNKEIVNALDVDGKPSFTDAQLAALIDHELMHAAPAIDDESGQQKQDERGRKLWRTRKHDLEEFRDVVRRHGLYLADLEQFAEAILEAKKRPLLASKAAKPKAKQSSGKAAQA